ncbi:hypothetical protein H6G54_06200 [Anabaena cylindrica FACHB-243]|uniref:Uncharacterized protein n=1 Tax=Anabaena cylindrica (strain ATCC 27899 / PCC 7122) TaxID=272123 RepID=K9ZGW0_ANACC|nr:MULTISPECIES: hypothetical protein [Anabaena]AFZ58473.1 hypothetical protein Anacy_3057 [Anabaena cylindrica PCC 7122]MBD2417305.1 hypothetical protein [Anabaena cylindrica FACHB-243]MBY5281426.1 hypothetical protein [Anabaena sp. CCAP 1446/1C]MBY5310183.1 hypothetical protein [Anabaena sp. CCAP 1446/1C]MCM2410132.1 hypothetical protein [Anabaena sp. CCAP 1446/1C]
MNTVQISDRITLIQNKLFEQAHTQPLELKFLAIAMNKQGIKGEKLYSHPEIITLPTQGCEYLLSFNAHQKSILSAAFLANFYKFVANSESQTLISNVSVAEKIFVPYSDEYMILHQETSEELDHIWSFRTLHSMVCRETGCPDLFDEPGFFFGNFRAIPQSDWQSLNTCFSFDNDRSETLSLLLKGKNHLKKIVEKLQNQDSNSIYRTLQFIVGDAVRMLPADKVQENGLGSLWLLYRYVANVELKQAEAYLFDSPESFEYEPLAMEMNQAHLTDEARHYTTSFDLGMELYRKAPPEAQFFIRYCLQKVVEDYIQAAFATYLEKLDKSQQGFVFTDVRIGLNALRMTLHHPELSDKQVNINELIHSWQNISQYWRKVIGTIEQKTWRYKSQQIHRLIQQLELDLNKNKLGNHYQRYQDCLETEELKRFIEVA